jgi:hypothetical protein
MSKRGKIIAILILLFVIVFETGVQIGIRTGRNLEKGEAVERAIKKYHELKDLLNDFEGKREEQGQEASQQKKEVKI